MSSRILALTDPAKDIIFLADLMALVDRATITATTPYVYPNKRNFYKRNLSGEALNVLAFDGEKVVGYAALRKMNPWPEYLPLYGHRPEECGLFLFNLVDPVYRRQGIGKSLSVARVTLAKNSGICHLFSTVHPDNKPSISVLSSLGFTLIEQKPMFTDKLMRNLMYLDLTVQARLTFSGEATSSEP